MPNQSYEVKYSGNKRIEQDTFHICGDCQSKLSKVPSERVNKFRSQTCSGCSKVLREAAEGKETPDFSSFIITLLEHMTPNLIITRLTRAEDVEERLDGAVKRSRAVTERHDPIQAHVYTDGEVNDDEDPESVLRSVDSNLSDAYNKIKTLDNFGAEVSVEVRPDGFTDVYVVFYHVKSGR